MEMSSCRTLVLHLAIWHERLNLSPTSPAGRHVELVKCGYCEHELKFASRTQGRPAYRIRTGRNIGQGQPLESPTSEHAEHTSNEASGSGSNPEQVVASPFEVRWTLVILMRPVYANSSDVLLNLVSYPNCKTHV